MVDMTVRLGVVGVGTVSLRGLIPQLTQDDLADRVRITALVDPATDRARSVAADYRIPHCFANLDEMLAADVVDAVTIATPIGLHYEQVLRAIEAGKHVHVNKTMCTTVAEADDLIRAASEAGVRLVASPGEVLLPQVTRTRELIETGAIGQLCWAICGAGFGQYHENEKERSNAPGDTAIDPSWYFRNPGGGPLYDMTVYGLHRLTSILGPAKRVTAFSGTAVERREMLGRQVDTEADDNTVGVLDFGNSVFTVVYGTPSGLPGDEAGSLRFFGSGGKIEGRKLNGEPFDFPGKELIDSSPGDGAAPKRLLPHVTGPHLKLPEPHVYEDIMQLVDWIIDDKPTPVTAEHARHVIDIIESMFRSARTGTAQTLRTQFETRS